MTGVCKPVFLVGVLVLSSIAGVGQAAEECVDYTPQRVSGVGGWLLHGDLGLSMRLWAGESSGLEACLLASTGGGRPWVLGKSLHRLIDTCYLDGYFSLGVGIPVGGSIDWQLADLSLGLELSLPDLPELTFTGEVGVSLVHYLSCAWWRGCEWRWRSQGFSGIGFQYYFIGE